MNLGYSYTVDPDVLRSMIGLKKPDRDRLLRAFAELADNPFVAGDFQRTSHERDDLQTKRFGRWLVTWWGVKPASSSAWRCGYVRSSATNPTDWIASPI